MAGKVIIYISEADKAKLQRRASADGQSLSGFIRRVVKQLLAQGDPQPLDAGRALPLDADVGREAHRPGAGV